QGIHRLIKEIMERKSLVINLAELRAAYLALGLLSQCKGDFTKVIAEGEDDVELHVVYGAPKVLLLVVDGARGQSVRDANIPNMSALLPNAIHTWSGLSEENAQDILVNWTDLFTGVNYRKHGVVGDDFSTAKLDLYPTF